MSLLTASDARLRKHADYQRVYKQSRKYFSTSMTYFYAERIAPAGDALVVRPKAQQGNRLAAGPRVGLTAGRVLGKAVDRNRIKRRMREAVRLSLIQLSRDVDVVLHPRRTVMTSDFAGLQREVAKIFKVIQKSLEKPAPAPSKSADDSHV